MTTKTTRIKRLPGSRVSASRQSKEKLASAHPSGVPRFISGRPMFPKMKNPPVYHFYGRYQKESTAKSVAGRVRDYASAQVRKVKGGWGVYAYAL